MLWPVMILLPRESGADQKSVSDGDRQPPPVNEFSEWVS